MMRLSSLVAMGIDRHALRRCNCCCCCCCCCCRTGCASPCEVTSATGVPAQRPEPAHLTMDLKPANLLLSNKALVCKVGDVGPYPPRCPSSKVDHPLPPPNHRDTPHITHPHTPTLGALLTALLQACAAVEM